MRVGQTIMRCPLPLGVGISQTLTCQSEHDRMTSLFVGVSDLVALRRWPRFDCLEAAVNSEPKDHPDTRQLGTLDRRSFLSNSSLAASLLFGGTRAKMSAASKLDSTGPVAQTDSGKIRGAMQGKVVAFKGVPYGASTEGSGRFMPPAKVQAWTGVHDAVELGPASPQVPSNLIPESMIQQPKGDANAT